MTRPLGSAPTVVTRTVLRGGFTMAPDLHSWALARPFTDVDLTSIDVNFTGGQILAEAPIAIGDMESARAAVTALLIAQAKPSELLPTIGWLMESNILIAPVFRSRRGWTVGMFWASYKPWIERLEALAGSKQLSYQARRAVANMWLCTLEGRRQDPDVALVRSFLSIFLVAGTGEWALRPDETTMVGLKHAGVAFGLEGIRLRRSQMSVLLNQQAGNNDLQEWFGLHDKFLTDRMLGSITKAEIAFKHLAVYLTEHAKITNIVKFFTRAIDRPQLADWTLARLPSENTRSQVLDAMYGFFEWIVTFDDRFSSDDEWGEERIARAWVAIPLRPTTGSSAREKHAQTVQFALPLEYLDELQRILFDENMAWPKKRSVDWIDWTDPVTGKKESVYCPVLPILIAFLINVPVRNVQARRLDSGEGDAETFDQATNQWIPNWGEHAGHWDRKAVERPLRGVLRRIDDNIAGGTLCGLFINSNKTADRKTLFDERSGYVIEWHNEAVIDLVTKMRRWQERYNPVHGPLAYTSVRKSVFEKMTDGMAARRPACFYLFRYPGGNFSEYQSSPPSSQQLRMFWYDLLGELERRIQASDPNAPSLISSWIGPSAQSSPYTLHGLRHGGLTRLAMAGVHPWILQNILGGHAAWLMTLYYIKPNATHISEAITAGYVSAMRTRQQDMKQFLTTRTLEEAHKVVVASDEALRYVDLLNKTGLPNRAGHLSSLDHGICPNGRTLCKEGRLITDDTERRPRELRRAYGPVPTILSGAPDCTQCIYFITGTPYMEGLRLKTNEVSLAADNSSRRHRSLRQDVDAREVSRSEAARDATDWDIRDEHALQVARQELKTESEVLADLGISVFAHAQKWQRVRALARIQAESGKQTVPALLYEQEPVFEWQLQPRHEAVDDICRAATWFPSLRVAELSRERRETMLRLMVRNKRPPALALMTEEEANVATSAATTLLYTRFGQSATRKLFEGQTTFEELGITDDVDGVMAEAIGKPFDILMGKPLAIKDGSGLAPRRAAPERDGRPLTP